MVILLPRLPGPAAESMTERFLEGPSKWTGFDPDNLPEAVRFAATGGSRAGRKELLSIRKTVEETARANGFGTPASRASRARFDTELGTLFADMPLLSSGEALRDDFWTFVGTSLAPDVVHWRFEAARERYLGGVRNTFQRLWLRARALDRGEQHPRRWQLLDELTEDALVQITERPSISADPVLAAAVAEAWLRARDRHGKGAMETIMRRAVLRVRMLNEIRSLADLPTARLASVIDEAFGLPADGDRDRALPFETTPREVHESRTFAESGNSDVGPNTTRVTRGAPEDPIRLRIRAARRILTEATDRRWASPKSTAALTALQEGTGGLTPGDRNSLAYLLGKMRAVAELQEDVTVLVQAISTLDSQSGGSAR